jgi:predicted nucleotidyltransferase
MKPPLLRDESLPGRVPDLDRLVDARTQWLTEAVTRLRSRPFVTGAWLYGSLAAAAGDAYSDIDLVVAVDAAMPVAVLEDPVAGLDLPGRILFSRAKPRNAPAGGGYRGVCVEAAGLPLLVDLCVWPAATAAVPSDGRLLYARSDPPRSQLGFMTLLDGHRSSDTRGADAGAPENLLYLVQLAAKYLARGDTSRQTAIH